MKAILDPRLKRSKGLTLIEVLAASAILSMVLVGMVMARSGLVKQYHLAKTQTEHLEVIEEQLQKWWQEPSSIPREGRGEIKDTEIQYRSEVKPLESKHLGMEIVKLEFFDLKGEQITELELLLEGGDG